MRLAPHTAQHLLGPSSPGTVPRPPPGAAPGGTCGSLGYWERPRAVGLPPGRSLPPRCVLRPHRPARGPRRFAPRLHGAPCRSPSQPVGRFPWSRAWTPPTSGRGRVPARPAALCGSPTRCRSHRPSGSRLALLTGAAEGRLLLRLLGSTRRWRSAETREDRGPLPRRSKPAAGGGTLGPRSHAPPLAGLPPAPGTFAGPAAPLTARPVRLSPQDAWGACTPPGDDRVSSCVHSKIALHGALQCVVRLGAPGEPSKGALAPSLTTPRRAPARAAT